jgi:hypothetical protein
MIEVVPERYLRRTEVRLKGQRVSFTRTLWIPHALVPFGVPESTAILPKLAWGTSIAPIATCGASHFRSKPVRQ